ncbi:MAG TPA: translocation/assembly module TamB domain-containing protein [Puia sp.]
MQNIARGKAEKYLSRKLKTRVNIGHLSIVLFRSVELDNVYLEDRQKDTLLSAGKLKVDLRMWGLLHNDIDIRDLQLSDFTAKIERQLPDTAFNFQFIIDAFAGAPSTQPAKPAAKPMKMEFGKLLLDRVRLVYKDTVTGNDMEVYIGHSKTEMKEFDPTNLRFNVTKFELKDLQAKIYQGQPLATAVTNKTPAAASSKTPASSAQTGASTSSSTPFQLQLGTIDIANSHLDYRNFVGALFTDLQLGHLAAVVQNFDLNKETINLKELSLDSTTTAVRLGKIAHGTAGAKASHNAGISAKGVAATKPATPASDTSSWRFTVGSLHFNGNNIQFDDDNQRRQKDGMDYAHLKINRLTLYGDDLSYSADATSGKLTKGSFTEQSGFNLIRLQTRFLYTNHQTFLKDLLLQTPGTLLQRSAVLQYASLSGMMKDPRHTLIDLDLPNSRIQVKDILTFVPSLRTQPVFAHPADTWSLNTHIKGNLDALTIQTMQFNGIRDLRLDAAGTILHPLDARNITANLNIRQLSGSRSTLVAVLPKGALPSNISIPAHFDLRGRINGGMQGFASDLVLNTSSGTIVLKGFVRQFRQPKEATYDLVFRTKALDLGYILQDSAQYGHLSSGFTIKGRGLDLNSANAVFNGKIDVLTFRHYTYQGLAIDGSIADRKATLHSAIQNTAVHFELQATADLAQKFPALKLDWQVDTVDLLALHLVKDTMQFKGHITADFADTNPDSLQGSLKVAGLNLLQGHQRVTTDSIALIATRKADIEEIQLHSEMADLDWKGHYKLTETATALQHTINKYYKIPGFRDTAFTAQDWIMDLHFRTSPLVLAFMPSLRGTDTVGGHLVFNSDRNDFQLGLRAPRIVFGTQFFHDIDIDAATGDSSFRYAVTMADGHGSGLLLYKTSVSGAVQNNHLTTTLLLKDQKGKDRYRLAGQLDQQQNALKFAFNADSLLLNYDRWQVSRDNFLQYDSTGVLAHDFTLSNNNDSLSLNTNGATGAAPLDVRFSNFRLSTISRLANQDSVIADGILNGNAEVKDLTTNPVFTSDLKIANLSYKTDTVGDLAIKVNNKKTNAFSADIGLKGKNNDIAITGDYYTGEGKMDLKLDLRRINLGAFSHAAEGVIDNMSGYITGKFSIAGTMDKPTIRGNLYFDSSMITPTISGEKLNVSKDRIAFDEDGFNFSQFELRDSAGNKLILDGNVFTKDYHSFGFDISLNAQNFRLVNAPESSTRQFYGQLNLDAAINLEGKMDAPKVDGVIRVNKQTNFYYVLPANDPEVGDRIGVVRFIDRRTGDTLVDHKALALRAKKTEIKGLDISLNFLTDTSAIFNVVVDPRSGDALNVRGRSNLVFQLEKSGKMDLTGSFEVAGGYYSVSFNVLKRKFAIDRTSVITWTGDPTTATVDLTASYATLTPSYDLVSNEISTLSPTDQNKFRQKLPFLVTLKMEGDLLKPTITFDVSLPTNVLTLWPDVDQRLTQLRTQQSEMNKQVFALLLLGRFVGEDPLAPDKGGGATVGNLAFSSASQILTSQMDQLAASLIKEVDIHFDLNNQQDFSTGNEIDYTELDVTLSKSLMQDRIRVSVGSSFDVVGSGAPQQAPSNLAGNVDVAYKLSRDGRYLLRAYRQNQYEAVILGQVIETGVGFVFTFDYDKFKEIWHRAKGDTLGERKTLKPGNPSK